MFVIWFHDCSHSFDWPLAGNESLSGNIHKERSIVNGNYVWIGMTGNCIDVISSDDNFHLLILDWRILILRVQHHAFAFQQVFKMLHPHILHCIAEVQIVHGEHLRLLLLVALELVWKVTYDGDVIGCKYLPHVILKHALPLVGHTIPHNWTFLAHVL